MIIARSGTQSAKHMFFNFFLKKCYQSLLAIISLKVEIRSFHLVQSASKKFNEKGSTICQARKLMPESIKDR